MRPCVAGWRSSGTQWPEAVCVARFQRGVCGAARPGAIRPPFQWATIAAASEGENCMARSQDYIPDSRNAHALVYLNGQLLPRGEAKVSLFDGGFVVGDGIWEGIRLHQGKVLFLDEHIDRLYWGASQIRLDIGLDRQTLIGELKRTLVANDMRDGVHIRMMVTRGEKSAPNQDPRNALGRPTIAIVAEHKLPSPKLLAEGLSLFTSSIRCTPATMFDMRLNSLPIESDHGTAAGHRGRRGRSADARSKWICVQLHCHQLLLRTPWRAHDINGR